MNKKLRILFVDDDDALRTTFTMGLEAEGYAVDSVSSTREALVLLANRVYPLVITDIYLDERTGLDVLKAAKDNNPDTAVIVITGQGTIETVVKATSGGAFEYLAKPFDMTKLLGAVRKAAESLETKVGKNAPEVQIPETEMIGFTTEMVEVYKTISRAAPSDAPVLIQGESGTGKEVVARLIHQNSKRADGPFVAVDCGSIAPTLMESELFGSVRGAFTGAERDRAGLFESADGGTVFLDEIGEVDSSFQLKLLRFLQEKEVRPLGAAKARKLDVRVVAATNRALQPMVDSGEFRQDLWFRLNVVPIRLPALRERRDDIVHLSGHFLKLFNARYSRKMQLAPSGLRVLQENDWPGNVRQLQHVLERLVILSSADTLDAAAVGEALSVSEPKERPVQSLADAEEEQIRKVLAATGGNKTRAAQILSIERKTLYRKLERMKIDS
ncbi:MAG: sigma-54 dependent transcriptional regulator [Acidobacteria bacterium]|nr:sigma-54 dependent transcriptional regulator [Acidobacteriota bacterium]MDA1234678.1 sigma-54 dependent transcriptional regulator [Acidobacteriota bacterium]